MRIFRQRIPARTSDAPPDAALTLAYERRIRSRQRLCLDNGEEIGLQLPRGTILRHGDRLLGDDGLVVLVKAAREPLSHARTEDPLRLARACYHLGNRHVPLQIDPDGLYYLRDDVLDALLQGLGLAVAHVEAPFHPEPGAYQGHDHGRAA